MSAYVSFTPSCVFTHSQWFLCYLGYSLTKCHKNFCRPALFWPPFILEIIITLLLRYTLNTSFTFLRSLTFQLYEENQIKKRLSNSYTNVIKMFSSNVLCTARNKHTSNKSTLHPNKMITHVRKWHFLFLTKIFAIYIT